MSKKYTFVSAVHLFLIDDTGKILLARRFNTGYEDGNYSVVAGHVEENETIRQAARREAMEEAGIDIALEDLQFIHVMHRRREKSHQPDRIDFFMLVENWKGDPTIMENDKCDDLAWFAPDDLPENTIPYIRQAITAFWQQKGFSEFGW